MRELTSRSFVRLSDGTAVPFDSLTKAQKQKLFKQMKLRLSKEMSAYYTAHPDEYLRLCSR